MEMIWLIKGRFIKYLRVHTHVIHFLLRSGTATSRHSRLGDCGPFFYPVMVGNSCRFRRLRAQGRSSSASHSPGTKPPVHVGTCWALPAGGHCPELPTIPSPWFLSSGHFPPGFFLGSLGVSSCRPHSGPSAAPLRCARLAAGSAGPRFHGARGSCSGPPARARTSPTRRAQAWHPGVGGPPQPARLPCWPGS